MQDGVQCHSTAMISQTGTLRWGERRSPGNRMDVCNCACVALPQSPLSAGGAALPVAHPGELVWAGGWSAQALQLWAARTGPAAFVATLSPLPGHLPGVVAASALSAPARAPLLHPQGTGGRSQSCPSCHLLRLRPGWLTDARHQAGAVLFAAQALRGCLTAAACGVHQHPALLS